MEDFKHNSEENYIEIIQRLVKCVVILLVIIVGLIALNFMDLTSPEKKKAIPYQASLAAMPGPNNFAAIDTSFVSAPDSVSMDKEKNAEQLKYGKELVMNTALYFGPKGTVEKLSNGMNCQNCHLNAGRKPFGNNYLAVATTYPKFRERSGTVENIYKRAGDCFERSLNGKAPDSSSTEMQAIAAYIRWLGKDQPKGKKPRGSGIEDLAYLNRAADPEKGKGVYIKHCKTCHGANGEGKMKASGISYEYPPLWGEHSYNTGAGLYRISRFAGFVKYNMPRGASFDHLILSDEEAWDVAAFVNSQPRPDKDLRSDWPNIAGKPIDHPFGPYADRFSENQHKFGPFGPIAEAKKKAKK